MNSIRVLQGVGALGVLSGAVPIWHSFQRRMCTLASNAGDRCGPNIVWFPARSPRFSKSDFFRSRLVADSLALRARMDEKSTGALGRSKMAAAMRCV
ncbi:hypothetical protein [Haladaptatus salinisoli]|uniref:hypothetical protein n=1 Tax=Haladaptatus salinisoli TaxID=2884876 RepID=UPI001D0A2EB4|nr:hypothetical protein [Haladaptatus salinisoli]